MNTLLNEIERNRCWRHDSLEEIAEQQFWDEVEQRQSKVTGYRNLDRRIFWSDDKGLDAFDDLDLTNKTKGEK